MTRPDTSIGVPVQLTMLGAGLRAGERPRPLEWAGLGVSLAGLVLLTRPGLTSCSRAC